MLQGVEIKEKEEGVVTGEAIEEVTEAAEEGKEDIFQIIRKILKIGPSTVWRMQRK
jgi:hypothetical protein